MIYMVTRENVHIIILEPSNLEQLRSGFVHSPSEAIPQFIVAYSPDIQWTADRIKEAVKDGTISSDVLDAIIKEGRQRPEVEDRPYHPINVITRRKPQ